MPVTVSVIRLKRSKDFGSRFGLRIESGYRAGCFISNVSDAQGKEFPVTWSDAAMASSWARDTGYTVNDSASSFTAP
jgi:hypothetical protein